MKRFPVEVVAALALALPAWAATPWSIENGSLSVTVEANGGLALLDKAAKLRWTSEAPARSALKLHDVAIAKDRRGLRAAAEIDGVRWEMSLQLAAAEPELEVILSAPARSELKGNVAYPFAMKAPGREYRIVLPHKTGLMFTVEDAAALKKVLGKYDCYGGSGLSMPWFGVTDLKHGLMVTFDTPDDAGVDVALDASRVFAPQVYWMPSRGTAGYARKLRYRLTGGGYVEMCKAYRNRLIARGEFVTLREKAEIHPQLAKLIGALDLHVRGTDQDQRQIVTDMESRGVKKMLLNSNAAPETLAWMRERGHLTGTYKIYTDIHGTERGYPEDAYTQKIGEPVRGFAYSDTRKSTYRCPILQVPLMHELLPPLIAASKYEAVFLDVVTAGNPRECYAPSHPLDRRSDVQWRTSVLRYAASLGVIVGSEDGNAWAAPYLHYFEGMAMPRRFGYVGGVTVSTWPRRFELNDEYIGVELNERVRVPLWDLVFHDSVVSSWRWNFTPDRYPEDPKWWNKHDLLVAIAGNMPIFLVSREHLKTNGDRIAQSYKTCAEWNAKTGWDELVDHRALTPDRSVQESRFSSGLALTVNFSSDAPYGTLAPMSYRIGKWK